MILKGSKTFIQTTFCFIPDISLFVLISKYITHSSEHDLKSTVQLLKGRNQTHFLSKIEVIQ